MKRIMQAIIGHRKSILISFGVVLVFSAILLPGTSVNYNMVDYLPQDANSTQAIEVLQEEFQEDIPNLSVMVDGLSVQEAVEMKENIKQVEGVDSVLWLDDIVGKDALKGTPVEFMDASIVENYYRENTALFQVVVRNGEESPAVNGIYSIVGEDGALTGEALSNASTQSGTIEEVLKAMMILLPVIIVILLISTVSWIEPLLFLLAIGAAILINMGSNIFLGEISFVTRTVSPVLQLAVSLDYAIFLMHNFTDKRKTYEPKEAMFHAMRESLPTIAASASTTIIGFSALMFMQFGIGADLGLNLLKGIVLSFLSVMIFLPVLTLVFHRWIDKTMHRDFMPHRGKLSDVMLKIRIPFLILAIIVIVPAFLGQSQVSFLYGMGVETTESRSYTDQIAIEEVFGASQPNLLLVPRESVAREDQLGMDLLEIAHIVSVVSYASSVGTKIPEEYVPQEVRDQFYSDDYARLIVYTDTQTEGEAAFIAVEEIKNAASAYYDKYYLAGESAALNDMKNVVAVDLGRINLIAVIGIFIVLLLTFQSLMIPLLLIFTIESAIWINLSVPYFTNTPISFIGYLIISTVQLGATVDYAILMTHKYIEERRKTDKRKAVWNTMKNNVAAILVSASILATAGFTLAGTTSNPVIRELGTLLGRGTVLSFIMVVAVLPGLLHMTDKLIQKTTRSHGFFQQEEVE